MDAAAVNHWKPGASDLLLEHCFALDTDAVVQSEWRRPTAADRLEALVGAEMARRLLLALSSR